MTYTLMDDTVINVELYPDREILPQKTTKQLMAERLKANKELIYVIIMLTIIEISMLMSKCYKFIKRKP